MGTALPRRPPPSAPAMKTFTSNEDHAADSRSSSHSFLSWPAPLGDRPTGCRIALFYLGSLHRGGALLFHLLAKDRVLTRLHYRL